MEPSPSIGAEARTERTHHRPSRAPQSGNRLRVAPVSGSLCPAGANRACVTACALRRGNRRKRSSGSGIECRLLRTARPVMRPLRLRRPGIAVSSCMRHNLRVRHRSRGHQARAGAASARRATGASHRVRTSGQAPKFAAEAIGAYAVGEGATLTASLPAAFPVVEPRPRICRGLGSSGGSPCAGRHRPRTYHPRKCPMSQN